jgi:hypothetical protein
VTLPGPIKAPCPCGCGAFGTPKKSTGHPRECDPSECAVCRNGQNRKQGMAAQRKARKTMGVPGSHMEATLGNEENWRHPLFRMEVKAGAQVQPILTRYLAAETQAEVSKAIGDPRPLVLIAMPDDFGDGLVVLRSSTWATLVAPFLENP